MKTDQLIEQLAGEAGPVRRLAPPPLRALGWLAIALPFVALVVLIITPRPDLAAKLTETRFIIEQTAAFATAVTAAIAAFCLIVPGMTWRVALLPVLPFGAWVASLGLGCVADWLRYGAEGLRITPDPACFPYIALVGSIPAIAIVVMLRRGAPLAPHKTMLLGGLAAAALGSFGLRFFHTEDAGIMVLLWQFGSVVLLSLIAGAIGQIILRWRDRKATVTRSG